MSGAVSAEAPGAQSARAALRPGHPRRGVEAGARPATSHGDPLQPEESGC